MNHPLLVLAKHHHPSQSLNLLVTLLMSPLLVSPLPATLLVSHHHHRLLQNENVLRHCNTGLLVPGWENVRTW